MFRRFLGWLSGRSGRAEPAGSEPAATAAVEAATPPLPDTDYAGRMAQEIATYREVENIHALPGIYDFWYHRFLAPKLEHVFGSRAIEEVLLRPFLDRAAEVGGPLRIASLGSGDGSLERLISGGLAERGIAHRMDCFEVNPYLVDRANAEAAAAGAGERLVAQVADLNVWTTDTRYHACLANHSLHHVVALEHLFDQVARTLGDDGVFVINDMIGRNGHMRWPETLAHVERLWAALPRRMKYNHQLAAWHDDYVNLDCSSEGFEGIRAQDILPLLVERFGFEAFLGFGGIVDPFIDRGYGHNFDPASDEDRGWIERIGTLNDELLTAGTIKPTMMVGVARVRPRGPERFWPPLSAAASIRDPKG